MVIHDTSKLIRKVLQTLYFDPAAAEAAAAAEAEAEAEADDLPDEVVALLNLNRPVDNDDIKACLDESMMVWNNQYICPGFMVVPHKPHPLGNEWHTIACGISSILFWMELVEGKDQPPKD